MAVLLFSSWHSSASVGGPTFQVEEMDHKAFSPSQLSLTTEARTPVLTSLYWAFYVLLDMCVFSVLVFDPSPPPLLLFSKHKQA